jgi:HD-GYP domain-containing protein (c-di-GMP phosphodiesterase class II)
VEAPLGFRIDAVGPHTLACHITVPGRYFPAMSFHEFNIEKVPEAEPEKGSSTALGRAASVLFGGAMDGVGQAASNAWDNKMETLGKVGVAVVAGGVFSAMRGKAGLPKLAFQMGSTALGLMSVKHLATEGTSVFSAVGDAWESGDNLAANRAKVAGSVGPLLVDTALSIPSAIGGAAIARTVPVMWRERSILNKLNGHHPETVAHSLRTAQYTELAAQQRGLPYAQRREAYHAGKMHDCGKLAVPESLLNNTTPQLSAQQWGQMQLHPQRSYEILQGVKYKGPLRNVPEDARMHHEWMNGKGYPFGLTGEQIPVPARVLPPADVFDAVTSGRKYIPGQRMPLPEVKKLIDGGKGTHFEPESVDALWSIPMDKAITVLESGPRRAVLDPTVVKQFEGTTLGRMLDAISGVSTTKREKDLSTLLNEIYTAPFLPT